MKNPDEIIDMVYAVSPEFRAESVFVCGHKEKMYLRKMQDGNGRFLWADGLSHLEPSRLVGYPVYVDKRRSGLAFGLFEKLPQIRQFDFTKPEK